MREQGRREGRTGETERGGEVPAHERLQCNVRGLDLDIVSA